MIDSLSVFFPCYNEEENIKTTVAKAKQVLEKTVKNWEIIIVEDGSKDNSARVVDQIAASDSRVRAIHHPVNRGYGAALTTGFYSAKYPWIAFTDGDGQFDLSEISLFIDKQQQTNADAVIGYYLSRQVSKFTIFTSKIWELVVFTLFGLHVHDIDCAFKLISKRVIDTIPRLESQRGAFISSELLIKTKQAGFHIEEVGVHHYPRAAGQATGRQLIVIIKSFIDLFKLWLKLKPLAWELLTIGIVFLVALFMRLYHLPQYMTFLGDEGRDAIVMRDMVLGRHFPLIGPGTSIGNMYLGPLYYYLVAPSLWLSGFSPLGPSVFVSFIGAMTVLLIWLVGRQWFGRAFALAVSLLYALSPTVITYSRSSWNPNVMPFFSLLTLYTLWLVWKKGKWAWLSITAFAYAFVLNSHYLGLLLLPSLLVFWFLAFKKTSIRTSAIRNTLHAVILFLFLMSPLVWFDIRHGWSNFNSIKTFFTVRQETVNIKPYKALPNFWPLWQQINTTLLTAQIIPLGFIVSLLLIASLISLDSNLFFVLTWLGFGLLGLGLYKQHIYDHYFGFLFPVPFLLLGFLFKGLFQNKISRYLALLICLVLIAVNLINNPFRFSGNRQLARTREISDFIKFQASGSPFNLALLSDHNYDASYRYFLQLNQAPYFTIHDQKTSQLFVICEYQDPQKCQAINHPLWEIAAFGWSRVDREWIFPWGAKVMRLVPNPSGI